MCKPQGLMPTAGYSSAGLFGDIYVDLSRVAPTGNVSVGVKLF